MEFLRDVMRGGGSLTLSVVCTNSMLARCMIIIIIRAGWRL